MIKLFEDFNKMEINIKEISANLADNAVITDKDIPYEITEDLYAERFSQEDNYIEVKINGKIFTLIFNINATWDVSNSGGDGYITPNFNEVDNLDIDIDLTEVRDFEEDIELELDDIESIKEIEKWISTFFD
jgi:hypothetical protein